MPASFSIFLRLLASLILGALVGIYSDGSQPILDAAISSGALLLPPLLCVLLDRHIKRKGAALVRVLVVEVVLLGVLTALALLVGTGGPEWGVYIGAAVLLISVSTSFSLAVRREGGAPVWGFALLCAVVAWLGVGLHNLLVPFIQGAFADTNGNDLASLAGAVLAMLYVAGFGLAVIDGLIGGALRARLTRSAQQ